MKPQKKQEHHLRLFKILAQTFGLLVSGFFLLFIIGEGIPHIIKGEGDELIPFLPLVLLPVAGYFVTWFKEWQGAIIMIAGGIILLGYFLIQGDINIALIYGMPFILAGSLFLLHISKRRKLQNNR